MYIKLAVNCIFIQSSRLLYLEPVAAFIGEALLLGMVPDALTAGEAC